jgi:hypothetical protein
MSVPTGIQAAHRTDSHGHCPQNRLTCANQRTEPCAPSASSQSERTPRQAEEPHRRRLWLATPPRSCQPSSHRDWLTRRSSSIPRIWETTGRGRSTGSRHLHGRMCRPSRRVTSVLGHQLPRGMSGDLGSVYPPDTLLDERKGHAGAAERQCRRGRSPRPGSSWPAWPGAPARSAPTASARVVDAFVVEDLPMPEDRREYGMGGTLL